VEHCIWNICAWRTPGVQVWCVCSWLYNIHIAWVFCPLCWQCDGLRILISGRCFDQGCIMGYTLHSLKAKRKMDVHTHYLDPLRTCCYSKDLHVLNFEISYPSLIWRSAEEFEDTKGVNRIRNSKYRQHNGQKKKEKRTNNDLQNIHIKLKIE
jgi:hypothetical protein